MEFISSFTYCDDIRTEMTPNGIKNKIVNPIQVLAPVAVPGNYSFAISCNIDGFSDLENTIRIQFVSPSEQILNDTGDIKFHFPNTEKTHNKPNTMQFNLDLRNIVLSETGLYKTRILVNEELKGEYKIQVGSVK